MLINWSVHVQSSESLLSAMVTGWLCGTVTEIDEITKGESSSNSPFPLYIFLSLSFSLGEIMSDHPWENNEASSCKEIQTVGCFDSERLTVSFSIRLVFPPFRSSFPVSTFSYLALPLVLSPPINFNHLTPFLPSTIWSPCCLWTMLHAVVCCHDGRSAAGTCPVHTIRHAVCTDPNRRSYMYTTHGVELQEYIIPQKHCRGNNSCLNHSRALKCPSVGHINRYIHCHVKKCSIKIRYPILIVHGDIIKSLSLKLLLCSTLSI